LGKNKLPIVEKASKNIKYTPILTFVDLSVKPCINLNTIQKKI